ncbi:MAG: Ribonuclease P protein component [Pelotomaculum sp. PtaB.Bin104]|nr:MAG: Ribonuclease P protein component [Pelotomaculum sp. PtaB.Bin104]
MNVLQVIKKNKDYKKIYSRGKSVADPFIVIYSLRNNSDGYRFGFTVSKKVGNAVVRNRVRRIFKEVCRLNLEKFPKGYDYILLARKNISSRKYIQVEESLLKLFNKFK